MNTNQNLINMKKRLLFAFLAITATYVSAQQTNIVSWSFPTGTLADSVADGGIVGNIGSRTIRAEGGAGALQIGAGETGSALMADGWNDGTDVKFWSIKFKAEGYNTLKLSSKQSSDATDFGPKNWKVQYKWGVIDWTDVPSGTIECQNNWTGAVVNDLDLPISGHGSNSIYIRWIMTSNLNTNDATVDATGKSLIDEVFVYGTPDIIEVTGDTIIGFDFADTLDVEFNADFGLTGNLTYDIRAEDTTASTRTLTYTNGVTNYAATAEGWDNGADNKFWLIKFKADGYTDFKLYSKQRSGSTNAGPKNWKVQTKKSGGVYEDVTGGTVIVGNDWSSGVVDALELPATLNNPGTSSLYIRWIMTDNEDINGGTVAATGTSKIDNIIVTGVNASGLESVIYENNISLYPNPCNDILNIYSDEEISKIEMLNIQGKKVYESNGNINDSFIDVNNLEQGMYFVRVYLKNEYYPVSRKVLVL